MLIPGPRKKRILVIDDDCAIRLMLCETLRDCGYEVMTAANGNLGLESIRIDGAPDLVITDIIMPQKEGLETIRDIRLLHPNIRVIAMSGGGRHPIGDVLKMADKLGSDLSVAKPIDMYFLENAVKALLGSSQACA